MYRCGLALRSLSQQAASRHSKLSFAGLKGGVKGTAEEREIQRGAQRFVERRLEVASLYLTTALAIALATEDW